MAAGNPQFTSDIGVSIPLVVVVVVIATDIQNAARVASADEEGDNDL